MLTLIKKGDTMSDYFEYKEWWISLPLWIRETIDAESEIEYMDVNEKQSRAMQLLRQDEANKKIAQSIWGER